MTCCNIVGTLCTNTQFSVSITHLALWASWTQVVGVVVWAQVRQVERLWRAPLLILVLGSDLKVQVLQEEVTCRLEVVLVPSLAVLSPAAWNCLQQVHSFLHNHLHKQCLVAVGVATQVMVGLEQTFDALVWHSVGTWVGELKVEDRLAGPEWAGL